MNARTEVEEGEAEVGPPRPVPVRGPATLRVAGVLRGGGVRLEADRTPDRVG